MKALCNANRRAWMSTAERFSRRSRARRSRSAFARARSSAALLSALLLPPRPPRALLLLLLRLNIAVGLYRSAQRAGQPHPGQLRNWAGVCSLWPRGCVLGVWTGQAVQHGLRSAPAQPTQHGVPRGGPRQAQQDLGRLHTRGRRQERSRDRALSPRRKATCGALVEAGAAPCERLGHPARAAPTVEVGCE